MPSFNYPNARYTSNIGFALFGQDEVLAENWLLADQVYGSGSSINVNGTLVPSPNLSSTLPLAPLGEQLVTFQFDINGNISAYVPIPAAGGVTSFSGDSVVYNNALSAGAVTLSLIAQTANTVFAGPASAGPTAPTFRALVAADIPSLSGTYLPLAGGTLTGNLLFSLDNAHTIGAVGATRPSIIYAGTSVIAPLFNAATGFQIAGAAPSGHFLVGNGTNYVDATALPSGTVTWDQIGNAAAALSLSNANYATTFNQTSAVPWLWANTTVATVVTTNASPLLELAAQYWATGAVTGTDLWTIGSSVGAGLNGTSNLTINHTGTTSLATYLTLGTGVQLNTVNINGFNVQNNNASSVPMSITPGVPTLKLAGGTPIAWVSNASSAILGSIDTGISRLGAASLAIGNGAIGDVSGTLSAHTMLLASGGSASAPVLSFTANTNTGIFISGGMNFSIFGVDQFMIGNGFIQINSSTPIGWGTGGPGSTLDTGISRLGAGSLAIGSGAAGNTTGNITATTFTVAASGAAPTSAGTAGTVGQIIANGGKLYFCSATGAAGAATWNTITLVPIL